MSGRLVLGVAQRAFTRFGAPIFSSVHTVAVVIDKCKTACQHSWQQMQTHMKMKAGTGHTRHCAVRGSELKAPTTTAAVSSTTTHGSSSRRELLAGTAAVVALGSPALLPAAANDTTAAAAALPAVPQVSLTPQLQISQVIKGCWQLSGGHKGDRQTDRTAAAAAVEDFGTFYQAGITTWDAADHYGPAEVLIGRYLQEHPEQRQNIQVCTKYCLFSGRDMASLSRSSVKAAVDLSRQRLGVDKIDLMQLYWGEYSYPKYVDAALYLTELQADGVLGAVGVTNFDVPRLEAMFNKGAQIVSNQVQYSLLDRRPDNGMAAFAQAHNMALLPYGVVAGGFLSDKYLGVSARDVDVNTYSKGKYASVLGQTGGWAWLQRLLQVLQGIADKHSTSLSNVASRWVLQRPAVPAVILGARNALHVPDHRQLFSFSLDEADLAAIQEVLDAGQQPEGDCYTWERGGVF